MLHWSEMLYWCVATQRIHMYQSCSLVITYGWLNLTENSKNFGVSTRIYETMLFRSSAVARPYSRGGLSVQWQCPGRQFAPMPCFANRSNTTRSYSALMDWSVGNPEPIVCNNNLSVLLWFSTCTSNELSNYCKNPNFSSIGQNNPTLSWNHLTLSTIDCRPKPHDERARNWIVWIAKNASDDRALSNDCATSRGNQNDFGLIDRQGLMKTKRKHVYSCCLVIAFDWWWSFCSLSRLIVLHSSMWSLVAWWWLLLCCLNNRIVSQR